MLRRIIFTLALVAALAAQTATPQTNTAAADLYRDTIQPLLAANCLGCHNSKIKQGGFDLSTRESLLKGSEHGKVVTPGNSADSQLYKVVAHVSDPGMPFKAKKLPETSIAAIAEWIKAGVPYGDPVADAADNVAAEGAKHWAFRKPQRPPVPVAAAAGTNPIDAFIAAELTKRGIEPLGEADKRTLIRRAYLDLTGLPPTPDEVRQFEADRSSAAYEEVIDSLLASERYGERWGRHWLDIWRYSDWYGWRAQNQVRYSQRHIWRWRDWTVESLNKNKSYADMITEMLAGDEIAPNDPDTLRATGFLGRSWYMFNRNVWLQDTVDYTSGAFLGLTLKCARCHTHKYDPIPHEDYYRFRAFFEPHDVRTDRVAGEADTAKAGIARVYDADASKPTYRFVRGNENNPDTSVILQPGVPQLFGKADLKIQPVPLPVDAYFPDGRSFVPDDLRAQAKAAVAKAEEDLKKAKEKPEPAPVLAAAEKRVEAAKAAQPALEARITADMASMQTPVPANAEQLGEEARKLERAANFLKAEAETTLAKYELEQAATNEKKLGAATAKLEAAVKALKEPAEGYTSIGPKYPTTSSGRRLALARWIASKENPLTARVAINHIWLRHFGEPLVSTVFNFGRSGKKPSHPELLDWLAVEFMDRNWDMKAIHKLIVTSSAYKRRSSGWTADSPQAKADPENVSLWRMNTRRMEAESVRDSMIAVVGKLDTTMGGQEIEETKGNDVLRRSIYFRHSPDLQMDMLKVFDVASPNECYERSESIVPQQALALANSKLSFTVARTLAQQLSPVPHVTDKDFVASAFSRVLGRQPSPGELTESLRYLQEQTVFYGDRSKLTPFNTGPQSAVKPSEDLAQRSRESLVHVLLNHNDFLTIR